MVIPTFSASSSSPSHMRPTRRPPNPTRHPPNPPGHATGASVPESVARRRMSAASAMLLCISIFLLVGVLVDHKKLYGSYANLIMVDPQRKETPGKDARAEATTIVTTNRAEDQELHTPKLKDIHPDIIALLERNASDGSHAQQPSSNGAVVASDKPPMAIFGDATRPNSNNFVMSSETKDSTQVSNNHIGEQSSDVSMSSTNSRDDTLSVAPEMTESTQTDTAVSDLMVPPKPDVVVTKQDNTANIGKLEEAGTDSSAPQVTHKVTVGNQTYIVEDLNNTDLCGMVPVRTANDSNPSQRLTVSAVLVARNDNYGGHLIERSTAALRFDLNTFDEVVLVDFNSPSDKPTLVEELPNDISNAPHFKSVVVTLEDCAKLMQVERCENYIYEALARNVGLEVTTSDVIVSTNVDCRPPDPEELDQMVREFMPTWRHAVVLERHPRDVLWDHALRQAPNITDRDWTTARSMRSTMNTSAVSDLQSNKCTILDDFYPGPKVNFYAASVVNNVGDFQMGHRKLWEKANFRWARNFTGRNFQDSFLVMSWMNEGACIQALPRVFHIRHERGRGGAPENSGPIVEIGASTGKITFSEKNEVVGVRNQVV